MLLTLARKAIESPEPTQEEAAANRLAWSIVDNAPQLSPGALAAAVEFLRHAAVCPNLARHFVPPQKRS